jgi:hypothetical protein
LLDWLRRNAPQLAELYEGALKILFEADFPGKVRFVTHAMREIVNRVPDVVGVAQAERVEYTSHCDSIQRDWRKHGLPTDGTIPGNLNVNVTDAGDVSLPKSLYLKVAALVKAHSDSRKTNKERGTDLFNVIEPNDPALQYRRVLLVQEWQSIGRWAVGKAHVPVKGLAAPSVHSEETSEIELLHWFERLETALGAFFREFFNTTDELDKILEDANS